MNLERSNINIRTIIKSMWAIGIGKIAYDSPHLTFLMTRYEGQTLIGLSLIRIGHNHWLRCGAQLPLAVKKNSTLSDERIADSVECDHCAQPSTSTWNGEKISGVIFLLIQDLMLLILLMLLMLLKPDHASVPVVGDDFDVVFFSFFSLVSGCLTQ